MSTSLTLLKNMRWFIAGALATVAGSVWYVEGISPLREGERTTRHRIAELSGQVESVGRTIDEMRAHEAQTAEARTELDRWNQEFPAGSAMTRLPELVKSHFARFGVEVTIVRLNTTLEEPELPGYARAYWSAGMPLSEANTAPASLLAAAELEQQHRFLRLLDFAIQPDPHDLSRRIAVLNLSALIRK